MIIISDTTPLRYLIEIEEVPILPKLFGKVFIPEKVSEELQDPKTPEAVKGWIQALPEWLEVRRADTTLFIPQKRIGDGEREAFALALALKAAAVLLDDRGAAVEAKRLNITTIPTFALIEMASEMKLLDLPDAVNKLRQTTFRLPPEELIEAMLARDRGRKLKEREQGRLTLDPEEKPQERDKARWQDYGE